MILMDPVALISLIGVISVIFFNVYEFKKVGAQIVGEHEKTRKVLSQQMGELGDILKEIRDKL